MDNRPQKRVRKRIAVLSVFFFIWMGGLTVRLVRIQVINHSRLKKAVIKQNQNLDKIIPKRGTIYDRNGKILARSLPVLSVFFSPFEDESLQNKMQRVIKLKETLNLSSEEIERIKNRLEKKERFIWIKRKIASSQAEKMKNLHLPGIFLKEERKRFYPHGKLASHVLGGVGIDEDGLSGVELKYNTKLKGKEGRRLILRDAKRREYRFETLKEPEPGKDLVLTLDATIQYIAEKELETSVLKHKASWGTVIISQPFTGEILAMANYPSYNPNHYPPSPPELARNNAIHYIFEPGSTFKIVTASAALEANRARPSDIFDCGNGTISLAGRTIHDYKKFSFLSFREIIQYSSNVGAVRIGQRIGKLYFSRMIKNFGFGKKTGIDLPAEEKGIFRPVGDWSKISLASLSFGQEISVTSIQLLQSINIIANRGFLTNPKIVKKILISDDEVRERTSYHKRILSEETASAMIKILESVVLEGTGINARINGYSVAGKTGTSQKFDPVVGGYSPTLHTASFVGFVPVDKPAFSMVVVVDEPKGEYYGGDVASPLFHKIANRLLLYLRIPPRKELSRPLITAQFRRENKK